MSFMQRLSFSLLLLLVMTAASCSRQPVHPAPEIEGRNAVIAVTALKDEVPQFYTYRFRDKNISFFVLKMNDRVSSFLDACASCYIHKRGYEYEDGSVICRHCGMRFPVYKLEKGLGSCYPLKLEGRLEQGKYVIPAAGLESAADKF